VTNCTPSAQLGRRVQKRTVHLNFDGGDVSTNGGSLLLKAADDKLGLLDSVAKVFVDNRDPARVKHRLHHLIKQRVFGLACGYEDLNDHDQLRHDGAVQSAVGVMKTLASPSTLCRLEATAERQCIVDIHALMFEHFVSSFDEPPASVVLDFDGTDDRVHGEQEGRHFNTHYHGYCFFPLYVYCGEKLLVSYLRASDRGDRRHAAATLCLLVKLLRAHWPDVRITFRGDAGFQSALLLDWCDRHRVEYIMGFGGNVKLKGHYQDHIDALSAVWEGLETEDPGRDGVRIFDELPYQAGSWKRERRVIAKLEHNVIGANQRYIVTSLEGDPEHLYSDVYCERGTMENRHKEAQMGLFADRTSCHEWWANQLRVMFSALAYTLLQEIRQTALTGTKLARAQVWTLREQLLKIGAVVIRNTRRIELRMNSNYLHKELYMLALTRLGAT
jgi:hypothetical protein